MIQEIEKLRFEDSKIGLHFHTTPESIFNEFWNVEKDLSFDELLQSPMGGVTESGEEIETTLQEAFGGMKEQKFWAFANVITRKIHIWIDAESKIEPDVLRIVIGHEVGHILEQKRLSDDVDIAEEQRCDNYGLACMQTENFIRQLSVDRR